MVANDRNKAREQVKQLTSDFEKVQPQISQLKEDKKEIYKALTSCNFLRETENLPIGDINKDLVKAVSSYYKAEAQVHKVLEKYKEE
jgi:chromosome segregation ATPase